MDMLSRVHRWVFRQAAVIAALAIGAAIAACGLSAHAAQASQKFSVDINLQSAVTAPATGLCRSSNLPGVFGATVTVVCSTGAVVDILPGQSGMPRVPMNGEAYRYLVQIWRADELLGTVDSYTGLGTVTSWRVVRLANWDYIELTVGW